METAITATELARGLSDVLSRVRYQGERFVIERNGEPIGVLAPVHRTASVTPRELARRLANLLLPGDGFAGDLEAVYICQPAAELLAWPS